MYEDAIGIYSDRACKNKIDSFQLGKDISLKTLTGDVINYKNIAEMGSKPVIEIYMKNETNSQLVIQEISCSDGQVKFKVSKDKLNAQESTLITIITDIPEMTEEDARKFIKRERKVFIKAYLVISNA